MLVSSVLKVYYWFGAHFSRSLLVQALLMILVHITLLHIALTHRPPTTAHHHPFAHTTGPAPRPFDFWQWRSTRPYWSFLSYFTLSLLVLHILFFRTNFFTPYTNLLGYIALAIEATLPIPQLLANYRRRGCKGFRLSVVINWIIGDTFKMWFFFASGSGEGGVPVAFKICGVFQALCDAGLGVQFWMWGDGPMDTLDATTRGKLNEGALVENHSAFELEQTPGLMHHAAGHAHVELDNAGLADKPYGMNVR
ncbi:hypothetical protein M011DRAFT_453891 [Sporormia fimetaria CBS 119925]|uniref:PQ loop repeat protein n=1 Tax=Sporormia fimetaria CBS 119925 TaxID=1340428 RepID=A0A6A6UVB4_9PLEO|nr:hypothetical protein M011DRAFT_453891 [Sporormia fimetaria CBS 119925]